MRIRSLVLPAAIGVVTFALHTSAVSLRAQAPSAVALTGQVTSAEEGPMEGVLVSARRAGAKVTVTVVSDAQGRYRFPAARLEPGQYTLTIRAPRFDLGGPAAATVARGSATTADLRLMKTTDPRVIAAGMSNAEWLMSIPGTDQQKASIRGCTHCHTLERIMTSGHDADGFLRVLARMSTYPALSFPKLPQLLPAARRGAGEDAGAEAVARQQAARRAQAEFLASVNLSTSPTWKYELKTFPRPKGKATQVIYTEWDLPAETRQPHDVIVDSQGFVWYASFGEQVLGRLDPRTGKISEWTPPTLRPQAPGGLLAVRLGNASNDWIANEL